MKSEDVHVLKSGIILANRYQLLQVIGEGGFGITYKGFDQLLAIRVAIKEYYPQGFVTRDNRYNEFLTVTQHKYADEFQRGKAKFLEEARTLARFTNEEGIVRIMDFFEANNTAYIVMEYLSGINLKDYLNQAGTFSVDEILSLLKPVMESLYVVHQTGLIHRDISPDNIMLLDDGKVKLMDFGAARDYTEFGQKSQSVVLKHGYAPAEQYQTHGVQGPWTDIYALSATIYKCITGKRPEESIQRLMGDTLVAPSQIGVAIHPQTEYALMKGLAVKQSDRYANIKDFCRDLYDQKGYLPYGIDIKSGREGESDIWAGGNRETDSSHVRTGEPGEEHFFNNETSDYGGKGKSQPAEDKNSGQKGIIIALCSVLCLLVAIILVFAVMINRNQAASENNGNATMQDSGETTEIASAEQTTEAVESTQEVTIQGANNEEETTEAQSVTTESESASTTESTLTLEEKIEEIRAVYYTIDGEVDEYPTSTEDNGIKCYSKNGVIRKKVVPAGTYDSSVYSGAGRYTAEYYYDEDAVLRFIFVYYGSEEEYRYYIIYENDEYLCIRYIVDEDGERQTHDYEDGISIYSGFAPTSWYCELASK
ncbi:MAG: protein kinase [Clostridiales bacterium]|nr:protein kinase [Clostridiales bacterium]